MVAAIALAALLAAASAASATISMTVSPRHQGAVLDWADALPSSGFYDVYRNGTYLAYVDGASSTYTDTGLTNGTTYTYQVKAYTWTPNVFVDQTASVAVTPPGPSSVTCFDVTTLAAGARPPACWRPFADASPFNRKISSTATAASNSAAIITSMNATGTTGPAKMSSNTGGYDYNHANYFAKPTDPLYTIHCTEAWGTCEPEGQQLRIPAQAKPAGYLLSSASADRHLSVVQPNGTVLDLWQAATPSGSGGTLNASWGGLSTLTGDGRDSMATKAKFSPLAGVIRAEEIEAGKIDHALFAVVPCSVGWVYPALDGHASSCGSGTRPPMGARLQLTMTQAEINALSVPAWKKTILTALREYGMIVGDTGGPATSLFSLQFESGMVDRAFGRAERLDTWATAQGLPAWTNPDTGRTEHSFDLGPGVSWTSKLRVVGTCVSDGTC
jgi:hypothetical protein